MARTSAPGIFPPPPSPGPVGPSPAGPGLDSHVLILPCGHEIGVPSEAPTITLPASVREHESRCRRPSGSEAAPSPVPWTGPSYGMAYSPFALPTPRRRA